MTDETDMTYDQLMELWNGAEMKLRYRIATFATSKEGDRSWGIGGRIGYWPCVGGPFIQFGIGYHRISVWYGGPYED